ncbi:hypothetical protein LTS18_008708, partial [Coniosporium uncinatum]
MTAFPSCPIIIHAGDIADSLQMSVASPHRDPSMGASEDYTAPSGDALNHSEMATSASPEEEAADPTPTTVEDATPIFTPAPGPPAPGSTKRTQSCEHCRKQKIRCIQDNLTEAGKCHRCDRYGLECIFDRDRRYREGAGPSRKRKKTELDGDAVDGYTIIPPSLPPLAASSLQSPPISSYAEQPAASGWQAVNGVRSPSGPTSLAASILRSVGSSHDAWIFKSLADATIVELVRRWRTMSQSFPFVVLPNDYDPRNAFHARPMLTFAAVVVASSYDASLQQSLASEFRQALSARLLTTTDNKLDLLQGLLVFIAWHHQYMESKGASVYMLMQIAVGLLLDLRINNTRAEDARNAGQTGADDREKQRAYVGCYYLCCGLSLMRLDRPRNFPYSDNVRLCAQELAAMGEYATDHSLSTLVEVYHFVEDVQASLNLGLDGQQSLRGDVLHRKLQMKRLEERWKALQQTVTTSGTLIQWSFLYSQAHMYK